MAKIELINVNKHYGNTHIVKGVDITVEDGEFAVVVGPSGCGKSTLLRMIAGLEDISSGELFIDGKLANELAPDKRGIAMVFQSYALYPHMTVADNIGFALSLKKIDKAVISQRVKETAKMLQLDQLLDRKPGQLSGGQRQRVAIGRAIVKRPKVILFDEPLSNLDAKLRVQMRAELLRLHKEFGSTIIYVTHDQVEAMTMAQKIVVLNEGLVAQAGKPMELYQKPDNTFVAEFIGVPKMNMMPGTIYQSVEQVPAECTFVAENGFRTSIPSTYHEHAGRAMLGVRPEHLNIVDDFTNSSFVVNMVERLGSETYIHCDQDGSSEALIIKQNGDQEIEVGASIRVAMASGAYRLFHDNGQCMQAHLSDNLSMREDVA